MTKKNPAKEASMAVVGKAYADLKGARGNLIAKYMALVEEDMEEMRRQFSELVVAAFESKVSPLSVAEIARAMGTSDRGTVYKYLKDARERRQNQFLDALSGPVFEFTGDDEEFKDHTRLGVQDANSGEKWRVWSAGPEDDLWYLDSPFTFDHYSAKFNTYKPDDEYPAHIQWFIDQKEESE